jgi:hypothetical protein
MAHVNWDCPGDAMHWRFVHPLSAPTTPQAMQHNPGMRHASRCAKVCEGKCVYCCLWSVQFLPGWTFMCCCCSHTHHLQFELVIAVDGNQSMLLRCSKVRRMNCSIGEAPNHLPTYTASSSPTEALSKVL